MTRHDDHDREPSADERLVHGLLTTLAADHAAAQDRRVRAAMKRLERGTSVVGRIGRFGLARIAAAGALAATLALGVLLTIGPATNSAYATLQSISNRLATGNRSYRQTCRRVPRGALMAAAARCRARPAGAGAVDPMGLRIQSTLGPGATEPSGVGRTVRTATSIVVHRRSPGVSTGATTGRSTSMVRSRAAQNRCACAIRCR
jgi:hypothetical protein